MSHFAPGAGELLILGMLALCFVVAPIALIFYAVKRGSRTTPGSEAGRVRCPECAEWILPEAIKCRFCGARLDRPQA